MSRLLSFSIKLFIEKFLIFLGHIHDFLAYLINHPSAVCLLEKDSGNTVDLLHLMEEIIGVLLDKDLRDDCVAAAFGLTICYRCCCF